MQLRCSKKRWLEKSFIQGKDIRLNNLLGLTHPTLIHIGRYGEAEKGLEEKKKKPHSQKFLLSSFLDHLSHQLQTKGTQWLHMDTKQETGDNNVFVLPSQ